MSREKILSDLQLEYAEKRNRNLETFQKRRDQACEQVPGLNELLARRHAMIMEGVRNFTAISEKRSVNMAEMNRMIRTAMEEAGVSPSLLEPVYDCSICKDDGYVYDPSRRMCSCMEKELRERLLKENGIGQSEGSFDCFRAECYSTVPDSNGISPRDVALVNRKICEDYADSYPQTSTVDLLLTGKSGLGKSFLMQCMAKRIAERGFMPLCTDAYTLFEAARESYMDNDDSPMLPYFEADLLMLDDLGTEPLMNNITATQLFRLINERRIAGKHTVYTTNLSMSELQERYTERVTSRFSDKRYCQRLLFLGDDIRKQSLL